MNYSMITYILGWVMTLEAGFMLLPCIIALIYGEREGFAFLIVAVILFAISIVRILKKPKNLDYHTREGVVIVALSWLILSLFGALPFVINGDIPNYINALFETISGFTTTGASILHDVEALSHASLFWRSFTHWIGGMGVIVFLLVILPTASGQNMYLMKAESPGPSVEKLVPRVKDTAKILYQIYFALTLTEIALLILTRMPVFDALCITFGTAGTGGFGIRNSSCADYSMAAQIIITVFMILFGINFTAYFLLIGKQKKKVIHMEEVRWYLGIILAAIVLITINIRGTFAGLGIDLQQAAFQVASIITTTGYSTTDFDLWPQFACWILVMIMFVGACAGSTGGGIKVSRIALLFKSFRRDIRRYIHPRGVETIHMDGRVISDEAVGRVQVFFVAYILIFAFSVLAVSLDNQSLVTNFTGVAATLNNIGPGLADVGPTANYDLFSPFSKIVLMFDMLVGRLELFPMLLIFFPSVWKKRS